MSITFYYRKRKKQLFKDGSERQHKYEHQLLEAVTKEHSELVLTSVTLAG